MDHGSAASLGRGADLHIANGVDVVNRAAMTNEPKSLSDIKMKPSTVFMLNQHGYETVEDMAHLPSVQILRLPCMGGSDWRKLAAALGREPFSELSRRKKS